MIKEQEFLESKTVFHKEMPEQGLIIPKQRRAF
jgi:hypothetical protein